VAPGSQPDDFEKKLIKEIFTMPPGRSGFKTIKTIEETLRSKAGQLGGTRKEIPTRLDRLETMGLFKRETRTRGTGEVSAGELVLDHPVVMEITAGLSRPEAKERQPRSPRRARPATSETAVGALVAETAAAEPEATPEQEAPPEPEVTPEPQVAPEAEVAPEPAAPAMPFRWVTGAPPTPEPAGAGSHEASVDAGKAKPAAKRTSRRSTGTRAKAKPSRTTRKPNAAEAEDDSSSDAKAADTNKEPTPA
jgi:hypothetical protein